MKIQGIYKIVNCINNKVYIGQSIDIYKRFRNHKYNLQKNILHPLYNSFRKYGIVNFEFIIIEEVISIQNLDNREQYWLDHYKSYDKEHGYNLRSKAESNKGYKHTKGKKHSEETKAKISSSTKKRHAEDPEYTNKIINSNKNRIVSDETKRKISLANKGKPARNKGKKMSEEHKRNLALARNIRREKDKGEISFV